MGRALCIANPAPDIAQLPLLLERAGHEVMVVSDATAGMAAIQDCRPDIVLCEATAPGVDGYGILADIRGLPPALAAVPVVLMVEDVDDGKRWRGICRGADDVVERTAGAEHLAAMADARMRRSATLRKTLQQCNPDECSARFHAEMSVYNDVEPAPGLLSLAQIDGLVSCRELWREGHAPLLMAVEIDRFTAMVATLGGEIGDQVMRAVAGRLLGFTPRIGLVSALAGEGFAALLPPNTRQAEAEALAEDVRRTMAEPLLLAAPPLSVTVSIGLARRRGIGGVAPLLAEASAAARQASDAGGNRVSVFHPDAIARTAERLSIAAALGGAVARNELDLVFQPKIRLADRKVVGAEALLRWNSPALGVVEPAIFVPVAEEHGLIDAIGAFAFGRAAETLHSWRREAWAQAIPMAFNLSQHQLRRPGFVEEMADAVREWGLVPSDFVLEIAEAAFVTREQASTDALVRLRNLGFRLSMDDFGTGFSSLSYLHRLKIDEIKIDHSFVHGLPDAPVACGVVEAILAIAVRLDLAVVAEGVETAAQADFLRDHGVAVAQGGLFLSPMPAESFRMLMTTMEENDRG